jgi:hypothetical protein
MLFLLIGGRVSHRRELINHHNNNKNSERFIYSGIFAFKNQAGARVMIDGLQIQDDSGEEGSRDGGW